MDKAFIIAEIKRTARGGKPLGSIRFRQETKITQHDWGKFWRSWSDSLIEAGYTPNEVQIAIDADAETAKFLAKAADLRADNFTQARIDFLAERSNEGLLTDDEREEYAAYVHAIDVIAIIQAKARAILRNTP